MPLISSLFGRSPIRPVQQHMKAAVACAREVLPLVEAMAAAICRCMGRIGERPKRFPMRDMKQPRG